MRSSTMISKITDNARHYEVALRRAEKTLAEANDSDLRLQRDLSDALSRFAGIQLDEGAFAPGGRLQSLIEGRQALENDLRKRLDAEEATIADLAALLNASQADVDAVTNAVRQELSQEPEYLAAFASYQDAKGAVDAARPAHDDIARECEEKLKAFGQDRRYVYLRGIGFGTDAYRRGSLLRSLDRWVAGLCNYMDNRSSELTLIAMREANQVAFARLEAAEEAAQHAPKSLMKSALEKAGVAKRESHIAKVAADLKAKKALASQLQDSLLEFARKEDRQYREAVELLSSALGGRDVAELHRLADSTVDGSDDEIAREIETIEAQMRRVKASITRLRSEVDEAQSMYDRAKRLERDLRASRYTSSDYEYRSGLNLQDLLTGYMAGALSQQEVARQVDIHRVQVYTPAPSYSSPSSSGGSSSFGSGSFGSFSTSDSGSSGGFSTSDSL